MDKIKKIRQEIKRLRKEIKDDKDPLAPNQKAGYLFALADMESFLNTLSEEPDKSLEEAAEKQAKEYSDGIIDPKDAIMCEAAYESGMFAGAEWQKSQMVKDEVEGEIFDYVEGLIGNIEFNIDSRFEKGDKVKLIIVKEENDRK